ncbi:MAG: hypothetical protein J6I37_06410 [Prevotella sp.]|nr:hypothetical protein [Prevotella sp.]
MSPDEPDEVSLPVGETPFRLSNDRYAELSRHLETLLTDKHIFTEQHITADVLMRHLGINSNYLTEVIQRSGYTSFYDMMCCEDAESDVLVGRQRRETK